MKYQELRSQLCQCQNFNYTLSSKNGDAQNSYRIGALVSGKHIPTNAKSVTILVASDIKQVNVEHVH